MKNIDEVLQRLMTATDDLGDAGINRAKLEGYEKVLSTAKLQILSDLESIIGEESYIDDELINDDIEMRNDLRQQIKSDIRKYMGVEE